jgi:intracellular septation protein A
MMTKNKENGLLNLVLNILLPTFILIKLSKDIYLGPTYGFCLALSFPLLYSIYSFVKHKTLNLMSALGFISIVLTGGIGLLKIDSQWIAVKEAAVPALIGLSLLFTYNSTFLHKMLSNLLDMQTINKALEETNSLTLFETAQKRALLGVVASFMVSSGLNFALAKVVIKSPSGTEAFAAELGKMTALSFPVIALPATIILMGTIWYLVRKIHKLTNIPIEDLFII